VLLPDYGIKIFWPVFSVKCGITQNNFSFYLEFKNLKGCVIYLDPPYEGTTKYKNNDFDYDVFWDWVRDLSKDNYVFISEYNAPPDFECIWSKKVTTSLKVHEHEDRTEKLFIHSKN